MNKQYKNPKPISQKHHPMKHTHLHTYSGTYSQNNSKAPKFRKVKVIIVFHLRLVISFKKKKKKVGSTGVTKGNNVRYAYLARGYSEQKCLNHLKTCVRTVLYLKDSSQGHHASNQ